jgi:hypothetical protein
MATLSKGVTFSTTSTVTSQSLHDLIESAVIGSVTPADIVGNVKVLISQTTTPNASIYPYWYDSDPRDPILRVFAYPWNIWLAVGPHRWEMPLQNASATLLAKGCLVVAGSNASQFTIGTTPSLNMLGFLQNTCASGAWGPVACQGIGWALYASAVSGAHVVLTAGLHLHARNVIAGCCNGLALQPATQVSGPFFGLTLDTSRSGTSLPLSPIRVRIWGPRIGHRLGGW